MSFDAKMIIKHFDLEPLEFEGGYYKQTYLKKNEDEVLSTCIYYLLTPDTKSVLHRLKSDEIYHFYLGDAIELTVLGESNKTITLGNNVFDGEELQYVVKAGEWQGSCLKGEGTWALLGTTMAPGFKQEDCEIGKREKLMLEYPEFKSKIIKLT